MKTASRRPTSFAELVSEVIRDEAFGASTNDHLKCVLRILGEDLGIKTVAELERPDIVYRLDRVGMEEGLKDSSRNARIAAYNAMVRRIHGREWIGELPELPTTTFPRSKRRSKRPVPFVGPVTIEAFRDAILTEYQRKGSPYHTLQPTDRVLSILEDGVGVRKSDELERDDIVERFVVFCKSSFAESSRYTLLSRLSAILSTGKGLGLLRRVPEFAVSMDPRKLPKSESTLPPSDAEVNRVFGYLSDSSGGWETHRMHTLLVLLTGYRVNLVTAVGMDVNQVDVQESVVRIKIRRSGRIRQVNVLPQDMAVLSAWIQRLNCQRVFPVDERGGKWHVSGREVGRGPHPALAKVCRAAGIRHITFQQFFRYGVERSANRARAADSLAGPRPGLVLGAHGEPFSINGLEKTIPSPLGHKILAALLAVFPDGLTGKQMNDSKGPIGQTGWRETYDRLREFDDDCGLYILRPRDPYKGGKSNYYRIGEYGWHLLH